MTTDLNKVYTVPETAKLLCVSVNTVYRLLQSGTLRSCKIGGSRRIRSATIEKLLSDSEE